MWLSYASAVNIVNTFLAQIACNFHRKETLAQVFSCEFYEISKNTFFTKQLWATASVHSMFLPKWLTSHIMKK